MSIRDISLGSALCALLACTSAAYAADTSVFHDKPESPRSLPADNLPPFGMLDNTGHLVPPPPMPPGGLHRGPGAPPESDAPGPSLEFADRLAHAAVSICGAAGFRVGVAVIDSIGEARAMLTADGSDGSHVFVAMRKALTAVVLKMPSSEANRRASIDDTVLARVTPNMFVEGGAVPIYRGDEVIGAIGVSGAAGTVIGQQDEECAAAALHKINRPSDRHR